MKLLLIILTFAYGTHGWSGGDFQGADAKWVSHCSKIWGKCNFGILQYWP